MADDPGLRTFRFGECLLDLDRGTLTRSGGLVAIRAKTWALLGHLAHNAGKVVSKDELLDVVWPGVTVTEDSLTQAIRDLRRSIGDEEQAIVRTVARRGYILAIPSDTAPAVPGSGQPRVAVLPFRNLSADASDGLLLDGLVEEITHGLARFKAVAVIARHSAFAFRPEGQASAGEIASRLGADYLVEGSAKRIAGRLIVSAGLADTRADRQLWGESFDGGETDLLTLQQVIPSRVVARLASSIESAVLERIAAAPTASLSAFEHVTRGVALFRGHDAGANEASRRHLLEAIAIDPGYGLAHAYLALVDAAIGGYGMAPREELLATRTRALTAVELAPGDGRCHRILGYIRSLLGEHAAAEDAVRRAVELNPCDAEALSMMCSVLTGRGRWVEALAWDDRALALNPLPPAYYHAVRSYPLFWLGCYEESAAELRLLPTLSVRQETRLAATLALAGRLEEAAAHLDRAEALAPGWRHIEVAATSYCFERVDDTEHLLSGIRAALDWRAAQGRT